MPTNATSTLISEPWNYTSPFHWWTSVLEEKGKYSPWPDMERLLKISMYPYLILEGYYDPCSTLVSLLWRAMALPERHIIICTEDFQSTIHIYNFIRELMDMAGIPYGLILKGFEMEDSSIQVMWSMDDSEGINPGEITDLAILNPGVMTDIQVHTFYKAFAPEVYTHPRGSILYEGPIHYADIYNLYGNSFGVADNPDHRNRFHCILQPG